jgi:hypothetical protein
MALKRRIVLDDALISTPPDPVIDEVSEGTPPHSNLLRFRDSPALDPIPYPGRLSESDIAYQRRLSESIAAEIPVMLPTPVLQTPLSPRIDETKLNIDRHPNLQQFADFNEFYELARLALRPNLDCKLCGATDGFDADFVNSSVRCKKCNLSIPMSLFQEQYR